MMRVFVMMGDSRILIVRAEPGGAGMAAVGVTREGRVVSFRAVFGVRAFT
ncbi:hypothetical protein [Aureimonas leprariae]|nr:hypothetical protein [Aureimonas leprariae]